MIVTDQILERLTGVAPRWDTWSDEQAALFSNHALDAIKQAYGPDVADTAQLLAGHTSEGMWRAMRLSAVFATQGVTDEDLAQAIRDQKQEKAA